MTRSTLPIIVGTDGSPGATAAVDWAAREAVLRRLPPDVLAREPEVPWRDVMGMRDRVGHHYHRIVPEIVHASVRRDLGPLDAAVRRLLAVPLPGD